MVLWFFWIYIIFWILYMFIFKFLFISFIFFILNFCFGFFGFKNNVRFIKFCHCLNFLDGFGFFFWGGDSVLSGLCLCLCTSLGLGLGLCIWFYLRFGPAFWFYFKINHISKGVWNPRVQGGAESALKSILLSESKKWIKIYENCYAASRNNPLNDKRKKMTKKITGEGKSSP